MGDYERVLAAYLFLLALNRKGYEMLNFDIDAAWIDYCRNTNRGMVESELLTAAHSQGFQL